MIKSIYDCISDIDLGNKRYARPMMHTNNLGTNVVVFSRRLSVFAFFSSDVESGVESRSMTSLVLVIQATTIDLMHGSSRRITIETVLLI